MNNFDEFADIYVDEMEKWSKKAASTRSFFVEKKAQLLTQKMHVLGLSAKRVLELGCGIGLFTGRLSRDFDEVCGIDSSKKMIEQAKEINKNSKAIFLRGDAEGIPFKSEFFDIVICASLLHHVDRDKYKRIFSECKRVLTTKGVLVIYEHNPYNLLTQLIVRTTKIDKGAKLISLRHLVKTMREYAFKPVDFYFNPFFPERLKSLQIFEKFLEKVPLGFQYCIFAKKYE